MDAKLLDIFNRFSVDGTATDIIPFRIVHNDPKINNVLFTGDGEEVKCVIDLDTVMPGSCLFDFGDAYFGTNFENENYYRARNQLHLAGDILAHMDEMRAIVAEYM